MALRLPRVLGPSPVFWLNLQRAVDLYDGLHSDKAAEIGELKSIQPDIVSIAFGHSAWRDGPTSGSAPVTITGEDGARPGAGCAYRNSQSCGIRLFSHQEFYAYRSRSCDVRISPAGVSPNLPAPASTSRAKTSRAKT
jgi:hypothetical protein